MDRSQIITVIVALVGWFVIHRLTAWRDRVNHRRQLRTQYLIDAFRRLSNSANRKPIPNSGYFRDMEVAISDIQLFGNDDDVRLVLQFLNEFQNKGQASLDGLLSKLRNELRNELGYSRIDGNVRWFRPEGGETPAQ